jgi:hypothetical protein
MKNLFDLTWKIVLVIIAAQAGQLLIGGVVYNVIDTPPWENMPTLAEMLPAMLAGTLLTVLALTYPAIRSGLRGIRLFLALFLAIFGINVFLTNIEAAVFLILGPNQLLASVLAGALQAAWLAFLLTAVLARGRPEPAFVAGPGFTAGSWTWRVALSAVVYVALYFTAGILILPQVEEFYATQNMTVGAWFLPLQIGRGALYVLAAIYLLRSLRGSRLQVALAMAFMFPMLAGVAGLLAPNPLMPESIRYWHILEIGWSNVVYGGLVGYLFWRPGLRPTAAGATRSPVTAGSAVA